MNREITALSVKRHYRSFTLISAMAILMAGCFSATNSTSASSGSGAAGAQARSGHTAGGATYVKSLLSNRMTTAAITDPSLNNMHAADITIPAGWSLQGIELLMPCTPAPYPAFRAHSPDGLMQFRQEPVLGWRWDSKLQVNQNGCAKISSVISAADFLKYYLETMHGGFRVVGPIPVSAAFSQQAQQMARQFDQNNSRVGPLFALQHSADTAALRVEVMNGTFIVEQRLRVMVECGVAGAPQGPSVPWAAGAHGTCFARVDVLSAPKGKLDALMQLADGNDLPKWNVVPEWRQATMQRMSENNMRNGERRLQEGRAESQQFSQMMYDAFQQNMARSRSEHEAFMQQQASSFNSAMNNAYASMNARTTAASDWVDYALDQQTVTGVDGTVKISNAYSQTWSDGQGDWYQTNDPNENPNGELQGNWTQTVVVHGNGQPR